MFTGIVKNEIKVLKKVEGDVLSMEFSLPPKTKLSLGASVLLNGICSTVTKFSTAKFSVDYMRETRKVTTVDAWKVGDSIHFESSLRLGDTIDGHFVFGHVDTIASVLSVRNSGEFWNIDFSLNAEWLRFFVSKGSVAIDGVSLTVVNVNKQSFSVSLIPHTLKATHLGDLKKGNKVNIEVDMLSKYAQRAFGKGEYAGHTLFQT